MKVDKLVPNFEEHVGDLELAPDGMPLQLQHEHEVIPDYQPIYPGESYSSTQTLFDNAQKGESQE